MKLPLPFVVTAAGYVEKYGPDERYNYLSVVGSLRSPILVTLGAKIIRAPREDQWAPGYYSLLFEDPDGIRLELNHVPGKGLLA